MAHYGKLFIQKLCDPDREKEFPGSETVRLLTGKNRAACPAAGSQPLLGGQAPQQGPLRPSGGAGRVPLLGHFHRLRHHAGQAHTVKDRSAVMKEPGYTAPDRFLCGVDTALLAPPQPISKNSPSPVRETGPPPKPARAFTARSTRASSNITLNRRPAPTPLPGPDKLCLTGQNSRQGAPMRACPLFCLFLFRKPIF